MFLVHLLPVIVLFISVQKVSSAMTLDALPEIKLSSGFTSQQAKSHIEKHLSEFSFTRIEQNPESPFNTWLLKPREYTENFFTGVCAAAFGAPQKPAGTININAVKFILTFLNQHDKDASKTKAVNWVYGILQIIKTTEAATVADITRNGHDGGSSERAMQKLELYLNNNSFRSSMKTSYKKAYLAVLSHMHDRPIYYQGAFIWTDFLLNKKSPLRKTFLPTLICFIRDKKISIDDQCRIISTDAQRNETLARLYQETISYGSLNFLYDFACLLEDNLIKTDETGKVIPETDLYAHAEAAARLYRKGIEKGGGTCLHNLALLIEDKRILTDDKGIKLDFSTDPHAHYKCAGRLYRMKYKQCTDFGSLLNLANLIDKGFFNETENGLAIAVGKNKEEAARLYRMCSEQKISHAYNNLGLLIVNEETSHDENGNLVEPQKRNETAARLYRRAIDLGESEAKVNLAILIEDQKIHTDENSHLITDYIATAERLYKESQTLKGNINIARMVLEYRTLLPQLQEQDLIKFNQVKELLYNAKPLSESDQGYINIILGLAYRHFGNDENSANLYIKKGLQNGNINILYLYVKLDKKVDHLHWVIFNFNELYSDEDSSDIDDEEENVQKTDIPTGEKKPGLEKNPKILISEDEISKREVIETDFQKGLHRLLKKYILLNESVRATLKMTEGLRNTASSETQEQKHIHLIDNAQNDLLTLNETDKQRFLMLIEAIKENARRGKPETLKNVKLKDGTPLCTRRLNRKDRVVYTIDSKGDITIWGMRGHDETISEMKQKGLLA